MKAMFGTSIRISLGSMFSNKATIHVADDMLAVAGFIEELLDVYNDAGSNRFRASDQP